MMEKEGASAQADSINMFQFKLEDEVTGSSTKINAAYKNNLSIVSKDGRYQPLKDSGIDFNGNNVKYTEDNDEGATLTISNVSCLSGLPTTYGTQNDRVIYNGQEVEISVGMDMDETNDTLKLYGTLFNISSYMDNIIQGRNGFAGKNKITAVKPGTVTFILSGIIHGLGSASINVVLECSQRDAENNGFIFDLRETECIITSFNKEEKGDIIIPTAIENIRVTSIGAFAFENCSGITSVTIPDSITSIGPAAFSDCSGLKSIIIPSSVPEIHESTFYGCLGLSSIKIQGDLTSISDSAFENCISLTSIEIPDSVTRIGNHAFCNCSSLKVIKIPNGIEYIHENTFYRCVGLTSIEIPSNVTSIGDYAFSYCSGLTSMDIPDSVTSISDSAFSNCTSLTSINIPDGITRIHQSTFSNCCSLISLNIPVNVTSIDDYAFLRCSDLTSIIIPNTVTSIGNGAFSNCTKLTSITIPNSVTSIGNSTFLNCSSLEFINIPDGVKNIPSNTFSGCAGLKNIKISEDVTSIGDSAFYNCSGLTSITIPNSVTSIGICAFSGCKGLTSITIQGDVISISEDTFANISDTAVFYVCNEKVADVLKSHSIKETQIKYLPPVFYAAYLQNNGYLAAKQNNVYDFSTGDFTFEAWIKPEGAGTIISRKSNEGGSGYGGFLLVLRSDSTIKLATDNGFGFYEIDSVQTTAFDGSWHHIAGVRQNGELKLYFDGNPLDGEIRKNKETPLDVNNGMRLLIGSIDQSAETYRYYSGFIGEVRVWKISRNQIDIVTYMKSKLTGNENGLVGYWRFESRGGQDSSNVQNNMDAQGSVIFVDNGTPIK